MANTKLANLLNSQVLADMISAEIGKKVAVTPFANIDTTLQGRAGNTITVPSYKYIGEAADVAEGVACGLSQLTHTTQSATVKKVMKAVDISDEALLSAYGNPMGEIQAQLSKALADKIDQDCMEALVGIESSEGLVYDGSSAAISYNAIIDALDLFEEEFNTEKVIFIHPKQLTSLRKDVNFISADKYDGNVVMTGEVGRIANCRVVVSKRVAENSKVYSNPIVKLEGGEAEHLGGIPALTVYMKKGVGLETERDTLKRTTVVSVDQHYVAVVSNPSKVVLAKMK